MKSVGQHRRATMLYAAATLALVALLAGCGGFAGRTSAAAGKAGGSMPVKPVVLRMLNPIGTPESEDFVSEVQEVSKGSLRIEAVDAWHEDDAASSTREPDAIAAVRAGEAPLGIVAVRAWHEKNLPAFDALIAPLLIDRPELQSAVLHSSVTADMLAALDGSGLTGIGILPGSMRHPVGIKRDLVDVSDYQGASVATAPGAVVERSLRTLGAIPKESMLGGANIAGFDGIDEQIASVAENQHDDHARSMTTNVAFGPRPLVIFGNAAALAKLTDQNLAVLQQAARASIDRKAGHDDAREKEDLGVLCRRGAITFDLASQAQVKALRSKLEPVYRWLRQDASTATFLDRIVQLADSTPISPVTAAGIDCAATSQSVARPESSAAAASAPRGDSPPATTWPTAVDGTYFGRTTLDDLNAAGIPPDAWVPENWGDAVSVFDRGRFATTQHNDQACTWAYGRYAIDGDVMTWTYEGGGGKSPNNAFNRPGEQFGFGWSMYRDVLTLTKKDGMVSPLADGNHWKFHRVARPRTGRRSARSARRRMLRSRNDSFCRDSRNHDRSRPRSTADADTATQGFHPVGEPAQAGAGARGRRRPGRHR